jgi:hypothetical protein
MSEYPVMFSVRDTVSGNGYLAGVTLTGRALICKEDGKWWVYGVRPGAIAESGATPEEAFLRFRNTYKNVLFDFAGSEEKFEGFKEAVESFYRQPDAEEEERWLDAYKALRSGKVTAEPAFFAALPKEDPDKRPTQISVERLDIAHARFNSTDNATDSLLMVKAA